MAGALGSLPSASSVLGNIGSGQGRSRRPQQPGTQQAQPAQQSSGGQSTSSAPTFAQLQQQGVARPAQPTAPPQAPQAPQALQAPQQAGGTNQIQNQLQGAVSQALANPSRYDTSTFNTIRDSATNDLNAQYAKIRDTTDTNLASRGLAASTYGANALHDVDAAQSRDMSDLNSNLLQQAATTQAGDTQAAISGGNNYLQQQLNQALGLGNLGVAQQNANTGSQSVANQLSLGQGSLSNAQQQTANQANQFGQTFGLSQLQNQQQYGLQTQAQQLAQTVGLGNLAQNQQQITNQANQFGQTLGLQQQQVNNQANQFGQTFGLQQQAQTAQQQQFQQQLAQALGISTMQDQTQNRGIDATNQQSQLAMILQMILAGGGYGATGGTGGGKGQTTTVNFGGQQYTVPTSAGQGEQSNLTLGANAPKMSLAGSPLSQQVGQALTSSTGATPAAQQNYYRDPVTGAVRPVTAEEAATLGQQSAAQTGINSTFTGTSSQGTYDPTYDRWYDPSTVPPGMTPDQWFATQAGAGKPVSWASNFS